jgi:hypothetical protein
MLLQPAIGGFCNMRCRFSTDAEQALTTTYEYTLKAICGILMTVFDVQLSIDADKHYADRI